MEPRLAQTGTGIMGCPRAGLPTHLSFPEIAAKMFLSRITIKPQALSPYRKLGVSSCSQAVARSRELRLLEGSGPATSRTESITSAVSSGEQGWAD